MRITINRALTVLLALLAGLAMAPAQADINYRYIDLPKQDLPAKGPKIDVIESPLSGAPQIRPDGSRLRIEVDDYRVLEQPLEIWLVPSFGEARERIDLEVLSIDRNRPSRLWTDGRKVHVVHVRVPSLGDDVTEDLYDLHIRWTRYWGLKTIQDVQHRAVKIVDNIPATPRVATLADPQIGDPRAIVDAVGHSWSDGNLNPLEYTWSEVIGDLSPGDRWAAFQKTIEEINAQNPDFVLISGDLTFGAAYEYEFEDAYRLLNQLQVPTYITPGNHDGYDNPLRADGAAKWEKFFGPLYYSVNVGSDIHIVSINSYDWEHKHRLVTTWGGSVRDGQLNWLQNDLTNWRANNPEGLMMTFAHHDPSWEQSPGLLDNIFDPQDQQWSGHNRLPLRQLLNSAGVDVHFAGHTHSNRVARYIDDGSQYGKLVETLHGNCFRHTTPQEGTQNDIYHIPHCGHADPAYQQTLKSELLDHRNGPLFIETTTVSSEGAYWGWRVFDLARANGYWTTAGYQRGGVDSSVMGYPMTNAALADIDAVQAVPGPGGTVNQDVVDVGYYSHPSYFINVEQITNSATLSEYRITNNSLVSFEGAVIQSLNSCDTVNVFGGSSVWERTDKDNARTDIKTAFYVGAGQSIVVSAQANEGSSSCEESSGGWWFW
jgi:3',5'-cyclic AMP phosphodiesterase CpdA